MVNEKSMLKEKIEHMNIELTVSKNMISEGQGLKSFEFRTSLKDLVVALKNNNYPDYDKIGDHLSVCIGIIESHLPLMSSASEDQRLLVYSVLVHMQVYIKEHIEGKDLKLDVMNI